MNEIFIVVRESSPGVPPLTDPAYSPAAAPRVHATQTSAEIEAMRLASERSGKFVVFRAVKAFAPPPKAVEVPL